MEQIWQEEVAIRQSVMSVTSMEPADWELTSDGSGPCQM
jgi:hypothetical protein